MTDYYQQVREVQGFLIDKHMQAYDLVRIAKAMCCCGTCRYFEQHYTKDGTALDWGHCNKGNIQHSKKISTASCGSWCFYREEVKRPTEPPKEATS